MLQHQPSPADPSHLIFLFPAAAVVQEREEASNPGAAAASSPNPAVAAEARSSEEELLVRYFRDHYGISDPLSSFASLAAEEEEEDIPSECCICLQNDNPDGEQDGGAGQRLITLPPPCRQPVHADCLAEWIRNCHAKDSAATCPMCRQDLPADFLQ